MSDIELNDLEKLTPKVLKNGKTRSQIGKASKRKGKTGERFFADILSEMSGLEFIRVPNSGAFVGQSNRDRLAKLTRVQQAISLGDIICPEELINGLVFESKNYGELDFHNLLNPEGSTQFMGWLGELLYDCESYLMFVKNPKPLIGILCVKITRKGSWAIINKYNLEKHGLMLPDPYLTFAHKIPEKLQFYGWGTYFYMSDFKTFCNINKDKLFKVI